MPKRVRGDGEPDPFAWNAVRERGGRGESFEREAAALAADVREVVAQPARAERVLFTGQRPRRIEPLPIEPRTPGGRDAKANRAERIRSWHDAGNLPRSSRCR